NVPKWNAMEHKRRSNRTNIKDYYKIEPMGFVLEKRKKNKTTQITATYVESKLHPFFITISLNLFQVLLVLTQNPPKISLQ
ncbi:MAG: hypothetical protein LBF88_06195, partial [Planctomycetaceae bacterium]|nr:hypothetical protein [Planctomycetaceae bacterium]